MQPLVFGAIYTGTFVWVALTRGENGMQPVQAALRVLVNVQVTSDVGSTATQPSFWHASGDGQAVSPQVPHAPPSQATVLLDDVCGFRVHVNGKIARM
jgi:hypothetical protein